MRLDFQKSSKISMKWRYLVVMEEGSSAIQSDTTAVHEVLSTIKKIERFSCYGRRFFIQTDATAVVVN